MELPNNTHSSEAAKQMKSVAEGFNPELTTEEKIRAAAEFEGLVLSTFLNSSRRRILCIGRSGVRYV